MLLELSNILANLYNNYRPDIIISKSGIQRYVNKYEKYKNMRFYTLTRSLKVQSSKVPTFNIFIATAFLYSSSIHHFIF